nr:hypothetical protein [Dietzia sp. DQ11-44]
FAGVVSVLARQISPGYWRLLVLVPPVAWARVRISHHTPVETALGVLIGVPCGYWGGSGIAAPPARSTAN